MTVEATRLEELRQLLSKNGFDYMVYKKDGSLLQLNIWIGEKDAIQS